jgi:hypothetical protein
MVKPLTVWLNAPSPCMNATCAPLGIAPLSANGPALVLMPWLPSDAQPVMGLLPLT